MLRVAGLEVACESLFVGRHHDLPERPLYLKLGAKEHWLPDGESQGRDARSVRRTNKVDGGGKVCDEQPYEDCGAHTFTGAECVKGELLSINGLADATVREGFETASAWE